MPENAKTPAIRYAEFTDAWEQHKLGELLNEVKRPVMLLDNEDYQLVTVKRRNEGVFPRGILKGKDILVKSYFEIRAGDYLISKRQVVHGANGIVPKSLDKAIVSNEYLVSIGNHLITVDFLALLSKRPEMYRLFFISSYGVDIEKLVFDVEDWKKRSVLIPSKDEQQKICAFFDTINDLITLHQREYDKTVNIKKALLEKMFPKDGEDKPEIRFAGFTDAWELRELGEVAEFNPKATLPDTFEYVDLESVVGTDLIGHRTELKATAPSRAQRLARRGDVFYQTVRPYQKNNYLFDLPCNDYVFSTGYAQMRPSIDSRFLFSRLQEERFVKAVLDRCTGTSYPAISATDLSEIEIMVPDNKTEQAKIGELFRDLDSLITLHQRELVKLQNMKKALLEKMFV